MVLANFVKIKYNFIKTSKYTYHFHDYAAWPSEIGIILQNNDHANLRSSSTSTCIDTSVFIAIGKLKP